MNGNAPSRALVRWMLRLVVVALAGIVALVALIYFRQHSMIYHPRPYDSSYTRALPPGGVEIEYTTPFGKQTAFYVPTTSEKPRRLWVAFCGNGSLALDWTTILRGYPNNGDAFLLIDYPGYGKNTGYATIEATRASAQIALHEIEKRLRVGEELPLCAIGHSLGAAAALDFAAHHRVERVLVVAPFTSLRDEAARIVGGPLSKLLIENYDNRTNLAQIMRRDPATRVAIFHGTDDAIIPVWMGQHLAGHFPSIAFFPIRNSDHVTVLEIARAQIIVWMAGGR